MKQIYNIGGLPFQIQSDTDIIVPDMFQKFAVNNTEPEYFYNIETVEQLPVIDHNIIVTRDDLLVEKTDTGENRLLAIKGRPESYAYYSEVSDHSSDIYLDKKQAENLYIDPVFTSLLAMERRMYALNQFVLHCAYMQYKDEAVLFSAPSETGKTTQANLWQKYRNTRTVNGDRSLLSFKDNRLYANGWPVCGTSEVCEPESMPVKAIVMLSQEKENHVERMKPKDAFIQLYSQITINSWNQDYVNKAMDFIEKIMNTVPVYHLGCTISLEAVEVLEEVLIQQDTVNHSK